MLLRKSKGRKKYMYKYSTVFVQVVCCSRLGDTVHMCYHCRFDYLSEKNPHENDPCSSNTCCSWTHLWFYQLYSPHSNFACCSSGVLQSRFYPFIQCSVCIHHSWHLCVIKSYLLYFLLFFYWRIIKYNVTLTSEVQCSDSAVLYITQKVNLL